MSLPYGKLLNSETKGLQSQTDQIAPNIKNWFMEKKLGEHYNTLPGFLPPWLLPGFLPPRLKFPPRTDASNREKRAPSRESSESNRIRGPGVQVLQRLHGHEGVHVARIRLGTAKREWLGCVGWGGGSWVGGQPEREREREKKNNKKNHIRRPPPSPPPPPASCLVERVQREMQREKLGTVQKAVLGGLRRSWPSLVGSFFPSS